MQIADQVTEIVNKRKQRLPKFQAAIERMKAISNGLDDFERMRRNSLLPDGSPNTNGPYASLFQNNPILCGQLEQIDLRGCRTAILEAEAALKDCIQRNSRNTVQISVVGQARKGKSTILQTLSGLDDNVIPAFPSSDCTGATSIIHNVEGSSLKATISFKSPDEMYRLAKLYLESVFPYDKSAFPIYSMSDIQHLDMSRIDQKSRNESERVNTTYIDKLREMVDHYSDWAPLVEQRTPVVLTKKDEIITYVAQHNGIPKEKKGHQDYHKYLAVDKCVIECPFPEKGLGPITLIDSIGMGDRAIGIEDAMLYTVTEESDAVIHLMSPDPNSSGKGVDGPVGNNYQMIKESCGSRALDKWLFHLINEVSTATEMRPKNSDMCRMAKEKIADELHWLGHAPVIIDAYNNQKGVTDFFVGLLRSLVNDLDDIDKVFEDRAAEALKDVQAAYQVICGMLNDISSQSISSSSEAEDVISQQIDLCWEKMRLQLEKFLDEWRKKQDEPSFAMSQHCQRIIFDMKQGHYVSSAKELKNMIIGPNALSVMEGQMNQVRNAISNDFSTVDVELKSDIDKAKDSLALILCDEIGFDKLCLRNPDIPPREWIKDFAEQYLREQHKYKALYDSFIRFYNFEFVSKGFMTYEVRRTLSPLDPRTANIPSVNNPNCDRQAMVMNASLRRMVGDVAFTLESVIKDFCVKPSCATWAEVDEFVDCICYAHGSQKAWESFLRGNAMQLWGDQIMAAGAANQVEQSWHKFVKGLFALNRAESFSI